MRDFKEWLKEEEIYEEIYEGIRGFFNMLNNLRPPARRNPSGDTPKTVNTVPQINQDMHDAYQKALQYEKNRKPLPRIDPNDNFDQLTPYQMLGPKYATPYGDLNLPRNQKNKVDLRQVSDDHLNKLYQRLLKTDREQANKVLNYIINYRHK